MAHKINTQLQINAVKYLGALLDGYKYAFQIDVELEIQFIKAIATALLAGGLGVQLAHHVKILVNEQ